MFGPHLLHLLFIFCFQFGCSLLTPACRPGASNPAVLSLSTTRTRTNRRQCSICFQRPPEKASGYEDSGAASKGLVSLLTNFVNAVQPNSKPQSDTAAAPATIDEDTSTISTTSPASPQELLERIRDDYIVKNYLWTGNIDLGAFDPDCRFTDPTLSFTGTDTFVKNIQNLRPIVKAVTQSQPDMETTNCRSDLLGIELCDDYVQTRWNMVGELKALPWKPRIDVIGRTKFWFDSDNGNRVYFYDEEWEIPAGRALLQIITPAGTIPNSSSSSKS